MNINVNALHRFGLGAAPGDNPVDDPLAWLDRQALAYDPAVPAVEGQDDTPAILARYAQWFNDLRDFRQTATQLVATDESPALKDARRLFGQYLQAQYAGQVAARVQAATRAEAPFIEHLVHFWANHFAVATDKMTTRGLAGRLEFDAVRPHVLGRFEDMLIAVEQHPAMLAYLDQLRSIGPESQRASNARRRGGKPPGLNENLAREILELHTLGVHGGYTQADVTEMARALTGWTAPGLARGGPMAGQGNAGGFSFVPMLHEPGARMLLGKRYAEDGERQARAILGDLARHPATARHIATKLARHFVADDPPEALVRRIEAAWLDHGGQLLPVYRALLAAPESWTAGSGKFRTPWEWMIASFRATGRSGAERAQPRPPSGMAMASGAGGDVSAVPPFGQPLVVMARELGQQVWLPPSPAGWDDLAASWAGPDALLRRVDLAEQLVGQKARTTDPRDLARSLFGDALTPATASAIARADSASQGLALLLVSPEMMRR